MCFPNRRNGCQRFNAAVKSSILGGADFFVVAPTTLATTTKTATTAQLAFKRMRAILDSIDIAPDHETERYMVSDLLKIFRDKLWGGIQMNLPRLRDHRERVRGHATELYADVDSSFSKHQWCQPKHGPGTAMNAAVVITRVAQAIHKASACLEPAYRALESAQNLQHRTDSCVSLGRPLEC